MNPCLCSSMQPYSACCGMYINEAAFPATPEALMRSRYTAYSMGNVAYIKKTMQGKALLGWDPIDAARWAKSVHWLGLRVLKSWLDDAHHGHVEFIATYLDRDLIRSIHEISRFECVHDRWFYVDGDLIPTSPRRVSRNMPCPCGSRKKFKNCHES